MHLYYNIIFVHLAKCIRITLFCTLVDQSQKPKGFRTNPLKLVILTVYIYLYTGTPYSADR